MAGQFRDRGEAGRVLAQSLLHLRGQTPIVLALPRGGVPVAWEVAQALDAELDVVLVRKIGAPGNPEFALGAVVDGETPEIVLNDEDLGGLPIPESYLAEEASRQMAEIARRRDLYGHEPPSLRHRIVVVVDDGIATGTTMKAVLRAVQRSGPERVIVAVPVTSASAVAALEPLCDRIVAIRVPEQFEAVSLFYQGFPQITDAEVMDILRQAKAPAAENAAAGRDVMLAKVHAALAAEPRLDLAAYPIMVGWSELDGTVVLEGEVAGVAAKKQALRLAAAVPGVAGVVDRLLVARPRGASDAEILRHLGATFQRDMAFRDHALFCRQAGRREMLHDPDEPNGLIEVTVENGVVTLNGRVHGLEEKRLAGVLAWWVAGVRDVINGLAVEPPEQDSDDEVTDAVRLALEKDPLVDASQVTVATEDGEVRLAGLVSDPSDRDIAEADAWYVFGVDRVDNRIKVMGSPGRN